LFLDQPVKRRSRTIGAVGREPFGLQATTIRSIMVLAAPALGLSDGARRFHIDDNGRFKSMRSLSGVGEERMLPRCGIGARDELRVDLAGGPGPRQGCRDIPARNGASRRALPPLPNREQNVACWRRPESGSRPSRKPSTRPSSIRRRTTVSKTCRIALTKATMTVLRKGGMIRNFAFQAEPTKPGRD
jgi:hypothetical protein